MLEIFPVVLMIVVATALFPKGLFAVSTPVVEPLMNVPTVIALEGNPNSLRLEVPNGLPLASRLGVTIQLADNVLTYTYPDMLLPNVVSMLYLVPVTVTGPTVWLLLTTQVPYC